MGAAAPVAGDALADLHPTVHPRCARVGRSVPPGALLLALFAAAVVWSWRREPRIAFALSWIGIALLPVTNVLIVTGTIVAERTLFLPSVGFGLACGVVAERVIGARLPRRGTIAAGRGVECTARGRFGAHDRRRAAVAGQRRTAHRSSSRHANIV